MNIAKPLFLAVALASLSLPACIGAAGEEEGRIGTAEQAQHESGGGPGVCKGLQLNGLQLNGLQLNGLQLNGLQLNGLQLNGLQLNGADLSTPNSREVLQYLVECALKPSQSFTVPVDGVDYTFTGSLGLAPEWGEKNGHCDSECRQWVSACMISRVDFTGEHELISLRGDKPGLKVTANECASYTDREATYYGDIFSSPMKLYGCLSPGKKEIPRVCGPSIETCGIDVEESCDDVCDHHPTEDGAFTNCRPHDGDKDDKVYHGSITVFVKP